MFGALDQIAMEDAGSVMVVDAGGSGSGWTAAVGERTSILKKCLDSSAGSAGVTDRDIWSSP